MLGTRGNRLFCLAVAPEYFAEIIARLSAHGMARSGDEEDSWVRVVFEKPFGTDLASAKKRNDPWSMALLTASRSASSTNSSFPRTQWDRAVRLMSQSTNGEIRSISLRSQVCNLQRSSEARFLQRRLQRLEIADPNHFCSLLASLFRAI